MHRSSLWRAWAIYRLTQAFPALRASTHVGVGHFSVVLALPAELSVALLQTAEAKGWSREKLRRVAAGHSEEVPLFTPVAELD
jgi:hypothetical protein